MAPYHLSLPILKHLLSLPLAFSDLEFADAELHRNLDWLRANPGTSSLGLDFTVTLESFGVKEVAELRPGGREVAVTDENKEEYLKVGRRLCVVFIRWIRWARAMALVGWGSFVVALVFSTFCSRVHHTGSFLFSSLFCRFYINSVIFLFPIYR